VALCLWSTKVDAAFYTGNDMYINCTTEKGDNLYYQNRAFCMGFVSAVADVMWSKHTLHGFRSCRPKSGVTLGQAVDVFIIYLRDNPSIRHFIAESLVAESLSLAFPCAK